MIIEVIYFMLIGAFTGVAAGLLGIGGGLIIVPFSLMVFDLTAPGTSVNIPFAYQAHVAIATSLATIIFTSLSTIYSQQKKKAIDWPIFWTLVPGILLGAFLGAWIASFIPRTPLLILFASFVTLVGIKMWIGWSPHSKGRLPRWPMMNFVATGIGSLSAIIGIGGGTMTVPFLNWGQVPIQRAVAVSSTLGLPIAISGSLGFLWSSLGESLSAQDMMLGYVYLPAFLAIISTSVFTARLGVLLSHYLSKQTLSQVFSVFLLMLAIKLYYGVLFT